MTMTTIILLVLALYMFQIFLQETSRFGFDIRGIVGNRDDPPAMSIVSGRLDRAKNNMLEALPIFLGLALLSILSDAETRDGTSAALVFLIARVVYVPAYLSGIPMLRSLVWLIGNAALVVMAWRLI